MARLGRPSIYYERIEPRIEEIRQWKQKDRLTDAEIAEKLGVSLPSLINYKRDHKAMKIALVPPLPTPEEQEKLKANNERNRQKALSSAKSFIRLRAEKEELLDFMEIIADRAPNDYFPLFKEIIDKEIRERKAFDEMFKSYGLGDDADLPF